MKAGCGANLHSPRLKEASKRGLQSHFSNIIDDLKGKNRCAYAPLTFKDFLQCGHQSPVEPSSM